MSDTDASGLTIGDAIARQSSGNPEGWVCPRCWDWKGGVGCGKNVFIAFVGADLSRCRFFIDVPKKPEEIRGVY